MMSLMIKLPVHVQSSIICEWLADWKCIGYVDSSVCCKHLRPGFHHMLQSTPITRPMPMPSAANEISFVKWIVQRKVLVRSVQVGLSAATEKGLQEALLATTGIYITTFRICGSPTHMVEWASLFFRIAIHCINLERLYLDNVDTAEVAVVFANCKRMTHFRCRNISETAMQSLAHFCPRLVSLEYSRIVQDGIHSTYAYASLPFAHLANLRVLIAPLRRIFPQELIKCCPLLEELSTGLVTCGELDMLAKGCQHMVSFCTLLTSLIEYDSATVAQIAQHWPFVRSLSFESTGDHVNVMSDADVLVLVNGCKHLQRLHVGGAHNVDWKDPRLLRVSHPANHAPASSALHILLVDKLEPDTLQGILSCAPNLQCFAMKLHHLPYAAGKRTLELLMQHQVTRLCLGEGESLTDALCSVLAGLRELRCRYVDNTVDCSALIALAKRCPELDTLALQLSHGLVKQLPRILLNCPNLRTLAVTVVAAGGYAASGLTDKELLCACFKAICPKLVHIDLSSK